MASDFLTTAYGPPWNSMEGGGVTSTGVDLTKGQMPVVAVDPSLVPYGSILKIPNNPLGNPNQLFVAADTGGAIKGNHIDFFVSSGRQQQNDWGVRHVPVQIVQRGSGPGSVRDALNRVLGGKVPSPGTQGQTPPDVGSVRTITGTPPSTSIDYNSAIINSLLNSGMGKFDGNSRDLGLGGGLLSKILGAVDSGQYTTTTPGTPSKTYGIASPGQPAPPTTNHGRYTSPVPGAIIGRTDMGVDANLPEGHPIVAMGDSKVVGISPNWYHGQPYLLMQLTSGPSAGRFWYVAEGITPTVHPGQFVRQGQTVATFHQGGTGMELGWGSPTPGTTLSAQHGSYAYDGKVTPEGSDFAHLFGWNVRSG